MLTRQKAALFGRIMNLLVVSAVYFGAFFGSKAMENLAVGLISFMFSLALIDLFCPPCHDAAVKRIKEQGAAISHPESMAVDLLGLVLLAMAGWYWLLTLWIVQWFSAEAMYFSAETNKT